MKRLVLVFIAVLFILPLFPQVPEFWINQLNSIGISSLVVIGLVILTGFGGMTSFGQAAFVGLGAYATAYLTATLGYSPWFGLLAGLAITFLIAYLLGQVTLSLSGHFLALSTIALCLIFYYLFGNMEFLGRHDGLPGIKPINFFGLSLLKARHNYYLIWLIALLAIWMSFNLLNSRTGRAIRSLNKGVVMAEAFGIKTRNYKMIAFIYAALLASVAGWLYAHEQRAVSPSTFGLNYGIEYLFMAIIGGAASLWGAIFGAALIITLKDQIQSIVPLFFSSTINLELVVFGVVMILILHHAGEGLWPLLTKRIKRRKKTNNQREQVVDPNTLALNEPQAELQSKTQPEKGKIILQAEKIRKNFGGLVAVNDVSFTLKAGEIMGLIGPNGAGKSTTFNLITGVLPLSSGKVIFNDENISSFPARKIAKLGISRTFQHVQLIPTMSVIENVAIGGYLRTKNSVVSAALHLERESERQLLNEALKQLKRVSLEDYAYEAAGSLSLGQQRIVEIARALCLDPTLLLLDEPAAGLRYMEKQDLARVLEELRNEGVTILLVEHDMEFVMRLTNHIVVMDFGIKIAEGTPTQVQQNPAVIEAYLGGVEEDDATISGVTA